jgi:hypothetical protein
MKPSIVFSRRFVAGWSLLLFAVAPGAVLLRPLLAHRLGYWAVLLGSTAVALALLRGVGPLLAAALRRRPALSAAGLAAVGLYLAWELTFIRYPVERFHFLLFGVLGLALGVRQGPGLRGALFALLACTGVAAADELFQHYLASRVGDPEDVVMDVKASAAGIVFAQVLGVPARRPSGWHLSACAAVSAAVLTWFLSETSWGFTIPAPGGTFFSAYSERRLIQKSEARDYRLDPPPDRAEIWAFGDPYWGEGLRRLQRRNLWIEQQHWRLALFDDTVLRTYYGPVLDALDGRWTPEMADSVQQRAEGRPTAPLDGSSGPARAPRLLAGLCLAAALAGLSLRLRRHARRAPS